MHTLPLGQQVAYPDHYDPSQLAPIPRTDNRQRLGVAPMTWSPLGQGRLMRTDDEAAVRVLAQGMLDFGLCRGSLDKVVGDLYKYMDLAEWDCDALVLRAAAAYERVRPIPAPPMAHQI